jgi:hypothetical protein
VSCDVPHEHVGNRGSAATGVMVPEDQEHCGRLLHTPCGAFHGARLHINALDRGLPIALQWEGTAGRKQVMAC